MNFDELEKIMTEAGVNICPICGTPFEKYHKRQKTCGASECRKVWDNMRCKAWHKAKKEADPDAYRKRHNEAERKRREKKRKIQDRDEQLEKIQQRWEKESDFDKLVSEHGMDYGKKQAEKILASVPKIDVNLGGKTNDNVHSKDKSK
jgi:hypothetical protein